MIKLFKAPLFSLVTLVFTIGVHAKAPTCSSQFSSNFAIFDTEVAGPVTIVIDAEEVLEGMDSAMLNKLFGAPVLAVGGDTPRSPKKIKGVVVHLGDSEFLKKYVVGESNLTKGYRDYYKKFDDKIHEYNVMSKIDPDIMPASTVFSDYVPEISETTAGRQLLKDIKSIKSRLMSNPAFKIEAAEKAHLISYVEKFIELVHRDFPGGAIIKLAGEFQSADTGIILKSNQINASEMVDEFNQSFLKLRHEVLSKNKSKQLSEKDFSKDEAATKFDKNWSFINALVFGEYETVMAQKKENIVREGRLSMANGRILNAVDRFYRPWGPPDLFTKASAVLNEFIAKAKKSGFPMDKMSGGVDFALLEDGRIVILDFNFGAMDGFLDGINSPITANMFMSNVVGRRTNLLVELSQARDLILEKKWRLILNLSRKYLGHLNATDRSSVRGDMVRWLGMNNYLTAKEEEFLFQKNQLRFQK
ncbi:MAG: hypothetical protein SGJ18_08595 [Pseudomonadota bacterium]|nr:hypothetical protein [Pseudomonadota bacterium]